VTKEFYKDKDQPEREKMYIETGNIRVKVKYNKNFTIPKISGTHEIKVDEFEDKKILVTKLGEKECYLCKQTGHYKRDCPDKEKASKSFSNRVNRMDEMPDAQGGEEGEDEETGEDENKSQNGEKKDENGRGGGEEEEGGQGENGMASSQDGNNDEKMNSSNIDGQNTEENLTITSITNELKEKFGNKDDAWNENFQNEEKAKEAAKRTRDNLDSSASSTASPEQKVLKNNDDKKEKPTGKTGKNNSGSKKVEKGPNV
jgi:hypothetical protein